MALPLLSLRIDKTDTPVCSVAKPTRFQRARVPSKRTGTFFVPGVSKSKESADDRLMTLKKWFDLNSDGTAKHVATQPDINQFGFNELSTRDAKYWAKDLPNNAMCNIMTWSMLEISKARFEKYKEMGKDTSDALRQASKSSGLPMDYKPEANDAGNPLIASFLSLKRRSDQLKTLERESLRQALGVRRSVGLDDSTFVNDDDGETYDADILADVIKRAVPIGVRGAPNLDIFGGTPPVPVVPAEGGGYDTDDDRVEEEELSEFPAWMLEDPPTLPDRDLTAEENAQMLRLEARRRDKTAVLRTYNDRLYEEQRKRSVELEKRKLDEQEAQEKENKELREKQRYKDKLQLEYDTERLEKEAENKEFREEQLRRDKMQVEYDLKRFEEEKKRREAEEKEGNEGPLPTWDPYKAGQEIVKVLQDIEENYSGNDELKDFIYLDIVSFLGNPVISMNDYRNYAFMGPSGVGKTTWARLMGRMYSALGMYLYGIVAETRAADYISNYSGQTGSKTAATLNQNLENIILIDEAYSMARGGNKDYGSDAITAIVDWMDKNLGCYMLIIAGYERDIRDDFLALNEGLDRRFNNKFVFKEYTGKQMADILKKIMSKAGVEQKWHPHTWAKMAELIEKAKASSEYLVAYQKRRAEYLAKVAVLGMSMAQAASNFEPIDEDAARWAKFYDTLFSKQAGSMSLIASATKKYMLIPTKRPQAEKRYKYDSDMIQILLSFLPRANQNEMTDKTSDTYLFLHLPLGLSREGVEARRKMKLMLEMKDADPQFVPAVDHTIDLSDDDI